ncbi:Tripeptidyl-peptidase sed2 [Cladobotryum mycophilum]|uniref:tripeptidyl-peptidase II n=1 Tax=Cladobotryum mycophilum TaxID=491253 RepID=A0ABR0SXI7_9HYPO
MKSTLSVVPLFAGLGACAAIVKQAAFIPQGWAQVNSAVNPSQQIQFSIALSQPDVDKFRSMIGINKDHLSLEQVRALRAPSQDGLKAVKQWLAANGITDLTVEDEWINVQTTVSKAEPLLNMKLQNFAFENRTPLLRTTKYTLPDSVKQHIDLVHPLTNFMVPKHEVRISEPVAVDESFQADAAAPCRGQVTPGCIKSLYNITYDVNQKSDVTIGIASFLEEFVNPNDVQAFLKKTAPAVAGRNFTIELVNNGKNPGTSTGIEAGLDVEYVTALAPPANVVFYSTGGRGVKLGDDGKPVSNSDNEPYLEFLNYILAKPNGKLPQVLSISYGDDELSVPFDYADKVCKAFGLLTARGVSILTSSGDGGAAGGHGSTCRTNDGTNREVTMGTFPGSCEWITSVGATENTQEPPAGADFSSGGFSQHYPRPVWQNGKGLVDDYVTQLNGHLSGKYNSSMRAFPDISVVGTSFLVIINGRSTSVGGTSASTPTLASMIALVNDARLKKGKKVLGFLNELLYSEKVRAVLQDITTGTSDACTWPDGSGGWPAKKGWDAITGLGVPKDFDKFLQVLVDA